jgi:ABC-type nitrate/sulfonate/bicarbonate transport system permease component
LVASDRGLGYLMIQVQSSLDTPAMVMAVVLLTLLGVALYGLVLVWNDCSWYATSGCNNRLEAKCCCNAKNCRR